MDIKAIAPEIYKVVLFLLLKLVFAKNHPARKYVVKPPKKFKFKFSKTYLYVEDALFIRSIPLNSNVIIGFVN